MLWLLSAAATPPTDGFTHLREVGDCVYSQRDRSHAEGSAMRAVCTWSDVDPARLTATLADFESYDEQIFVIDASEVRRTDAGRSLVFQQQKMWPLSDREVLLWAESTPLEDGSRHSWTTASGQPLSLSKGAVRTPKNEGYWEVRALPSGGSQVTHQIAVDAGGTPIPGWLMRWIRTRGFARVMDDMREAHR